MKTYAQANRIIHCNLFQSKARVLLSVALLTVFAFAMGWVAALPAAAGQSNQNQGLSRAAAASSPSYDEKNLAPQKRKEWATVLEKLAGENIDCMEDCGTGFTCQEKCWDVYKFQLDREYQRLVYESAN